jgi:Bacterial Ig-like domain (group 2)
VLGLLLAVGTGLAACGSHKSNAPADEPALESLRIAPAWKTIPQGATQQFTATGIYRDGQRRDLTSSAAWNSSNAAVASINPSGLVTATGVGSAVIRAVVGPQSAATPLLVTSDAATTGVFTYHNDAGRTGQNLQETILTPANVNPKSFGKLFSDPVDGYVYAQPLYVSNVAIPGKGRLNVVYVATENDTVYAFDADQPGPPLWKKSLLPAGATAVPSADTNCDQVIPQIGITSTPVVDPRNGTIYVEAATKEGTAARPSYFQRLHALDIATGQEKSGGPVEIGAAVPGSGASGRNGMIAFDPLLHLNRPGLALVNGTVYIAFGSHCDIVPYHGWLFAYDAARLTRRAVFLTTPNGNRGAIWQSGDGPAVDPSGNLYVMTGNGSFDERADSSDSFLKLALQGATLVRRDFFTPFNERILDEQDLDVGSGGPMLLPDQTGPHPHLLVGGGKDGVLYLLNRDDLGGFRRHGNRVVQSVPNGGRLIYSTPAYWNGHVYLIPSNDVLKAFALVNGRLSPSPVSQGATVFGYPGATPSISADGLTNGIVWALQADRHYESGPAVLHAYNATNVAHELYNSSAAPAARDQAGPAVKFTVPTVFNGKVYIGTQNRLDVYGLLD